VQIAQLNGQIAAKDAELKKVQQKLSEIRPNVTTPVTRQGDGHIVRVASSGICYIDLGAGDQVLAGMTFEVYDRNEGIPPIPPDPNIEAAMPKGKGSIEVTRVGGTSSECRIVSQTRTPPLPKAISSPTSCTTGTPRTSSSSTATSTSPAPARSIPTTPRS
jgi:hypothetical protein